MNTYFKGGLPCRVTALLRFDHISIIKNRKDLQQAKREAECTYVESQSIIFSSIIAGVTVMLQSYIKSFYSHIIFRSKDSLVPEPQKVTHSGRH